MSGLDARSLLAGQWTNMEAQKRLLAARTELVLSRERLSIKENGTLVPRIRSAFLQSAEEAATTVTGEAVSLEAAHLPPYRGPHWGIRGTVGHVLPSLDLSDITKGPQAALCVRRRAPGEWSIQHTFQQRMQRVEHPQEPGASGPVVGTHFSSPFTWMETLACQ